jgi:hypothetical protein
MADTPRAPGYYTPKGAPDWVRYWWTGSAWGHREPYPDEPPDMGICATDSPRRHLLPPESDFLLDVLDFFSEVIDSHGDLFWRVNGHREVKLFVNCSDVFEWGTADLEPIETDDDLALLRSCYDELTAADPRLGDVYVPELYAARRRGMRPQGVWYQRILFGYKSADAKGTAAVADLFDACGPPRPADLVNPVGR